MVRPLPGLIIGGPTASGKTEVALAVAEACGGEIVGADAFQLYEGLPILTAQPSAEQQSRAPHHLVGSCALHESMDVSRYVQLAQQSLRDISHRGRVPILVGGTGLYIRSLLFGLAQGLPGPDPALRQELETQPLALLQEKLRALDPQSAAQMDLLNPRRVIRALEVCMVSGRPFSSFKHSTAWNAPPLGVWIRPARQELRERIAMRTRQMFEQGVEEEVRAALPKLGPTASQVIGLRPVSARIEGRCSLEEASEAIQLATRQYAKRQETWFAKENALQGVTPGDAVETALRFLRRQVC